MRGKEIQLCLILKKIGRYPDRLTDESLKEKKYPRHQYVQNIIYLLQRCGVNLGYEFEWLNDMPYSKCLEYVYWDLKSSLDARYDDHTWYKLNENEDIKIKFEACNTVLVNPVSVGISEREWAKFLSAIDYLNKSGNRPYNITNEDVKEYIDNLYKDHIDKYDFCYKLAALRLDNMYAVTA